MQITHFHPERVRPLSVLVVDDSDDIRARLIRMIQHVEGISLIAQASDASEALRHFDDLHPHAVFLDIHLPDQNGMELLKRIKTWAPSTLVIMLTNHPYMEYRIYCQRHGADFFFNKFTEFDQAIEALKQMVTKIKEEQKTEETAP